MIDEAILMPWLNRGDNSDHRYIDIYFALPAKEDEETWIRKVIIAYVSHKRFCYMNKSEAERAQTLKYNQEFFESERLAEEKATELSAKIYEEIK